MTDAQGGVLFDIDANHLPRQISWTATNSDDAWLVLDRNGDGFINNGKELFGDLTLQPVPLEEEGKNGFRALAVFDRFDRGGNGDGKISIADAIFADLRLWQDTNHNGVSEPGELSGFTALGLSEIELDYRESGRRDENNNWFRFRSKVYELQGYQYGRWAYDVFLQSVP